MLGIEADGTLKGCPSLQTEDWAEDNILESSPQDVWERSARLRYTRDRSSDELWGYCGECYYAEVCRGGCTWMAHSCAASLETTRTATIAPWKCSGAASASASCKTARAGSPFRPWNFRAGRGRLLSIART